MGNNSSHSPPPLPSSNNGAINGYNHSPANIPKPSTGSRLRRMEIRDLRRRSMPSHCLELTLTGGHRPSDAAIINSSSVDVSGGDGTKPPASARSAIAHAWAVSLFKASPPKIQINGKESLSNMASLGFKKASAPAPGVESSIDVVDEGTVEVRLSDGKGELGNGNSAARKPSMQSGRLKEMARRLDSRKIAAAKRRSKFERAATVAAGLSTNTTAGDESLSHPDDFSDSDRHNYTFVSSDPLEPARSLDESSRIINHFSTDLQLEMKPLNIQNQRSLSPLRQMRQSFGSVSSHRSQQASEESILSVEQSDAIRQTWRSANSKIATFAPDRCFGFFVLDRMFDVAPWMRELFSVDGYARIADVPSDHPFHRHVNVLNDVLELAVRNVEELESEMRPVLFTYGRRHYLPSLITKFTEENVRLFCTQVVLTMVDLLGAVSSDDKRDSNDATVLSTLAVEAWIEFSRYLGSALLSGFEHERAIQGGVKKKISINALVRQHAFSFVH